MGVCRFLWVPAVLYIAQSVGGEHHGLVFVVLTGVCSTLTPWKRGRYRGMKEDGDSYVLGWNRTIWFEIHVSSVWNMRLLHRYWVWRRDVLHSSILLGHITRKRRMGSITDCLQRYPIMLWFVWSKRSNSCFQSGKGVRKWVVAFYSSTFPLYENTE